MPRSPLKNLLIVISLLAVMAGAVHLVTEAGHVTAATATAPPPPQSGNVGMVTVDIRMLFSHPPRRVCIEGHGVDVRPRGNELRHSLDLPAGQIIDLPLDITWDQAARGADTRYFTRIIVRQDGKEDDVIVFADQDAGFADVFTIDTRSNP